MLEAHASGVASAFNRALLTLLFRRDAVLEAVAEAEAELSEVDAALSVCTLVLRRGAVEPSAQALLVPKSAASAAARFAVPAHVLRACGEAARCRGEAARSLIALAHGHAEEAARELAYERACGDGGGSSEGGGSGQQLHLTPFLATLALSSGEPLLAECGRAVLARASQPLGHAPASSLPAALPAAVVPPSSAHAAVLELASHRSEACRAGPSPPWAFSTLRCPLTAIPLAPYGALTIACPGATSGAAAAASAPPPPQQQPPTAPEAAPLPSAGSPEELEAAAASFMALLDRTVALRGRQQALLVGFDVALEAVRAERVAACGALAAAAVRAATLRGELEVLSDLAHKDAAVTQRTARARGEKAAIASAVASASAALAERRATLDAVRDRERALLSALEESAGGAGSPLYAPLLRVYKRRVYRARGRRGGGRRREGARRRGER